MKIQNYFLIAVGGALIGAATGFALRAYDNAGQPTVPTPVKAVEVVDELPAFSYPDLDGRPRSGGESLRDLPSALRPWQLLQSYL